MAQFESMRKEFEAAGVGVAYIAGQARSGLLGAQRYFHKAPAAFPYLCDEGREILRAYGVYRAMGLDGVRVAHPSVFLLDAERTVHFLYVGENQKDRVAPERLLEEFRELKPGS